MELGTSVSERFIEKFNPFYIKLMGKDSPVILEQGLVLVDFENVQYGFTLDLGGEPVKVVFPSIIFDPELDGDFPNDFGLDEDEFDDIMNYVWDGE